MGMGPVAWAAGGAILGVCQIHKRHRQRDLHKVPKAPGHVPLLGNIALVKAVESSVLHKLYETYGDCAGEGGLLRFSVLGVDRVVATTPQAFADILRKAGFLRKSLDSYGIFYMFGVKADSVFMHPDAQEHARVRRHMMKFFNADNVDRTISELSSECRRTAAMIAAASAGAAAFAGDPDDSRIRIDADGQLEVGIYSSAGGGEGALVSGSQIAANNILAVVFRVFLEVDIMPRMDVFTDTLDQANGVAAHPLQFQLLKRGLYPGSRRYRRNFEQQHEFYSELVRLVYAKPLPESSSKFWASVRYAYPDALTDAAQFELAAANLATIFFAGYETTSNAITHTLAALALDHDSQTVIMEELEALGLVASAAQPQPRAVTAEDLAKMPFLDAVVHESLRLMAPAPVGGLRLLDKDTTVGGCTLPKGTEVMLPPWALHYNRSVWGDDAARWRPDRWLEGGSVAAARKDGDGNLRFQPFLDGPSNCIGQHLALSEIKMVIASLLSNLTLILDTERMAGMHTVEDFVAAAVTKVTLQQEGATWLRMSPRAPAASPADTPPGNKHSVAGIPSGTLNR